VRFGDAALPICVQLPWPTRLPVLKVAKSCSKSETANPFVINERLRIAKLKREDRKLLKRDF